MRNIVYYVASSLDGYIAGTNDDVSGFAMQGDAVDQYKMDLAEYDMVIMGRKTYEFGYQYGLQKGQRAYPHMEHYIFSDTLRFDEAHASVYAHKLDLAKIKALKQSKGSDIYLCGGGAFAGWLLDHGQVDVLKLKLNPIILGGGVKVFGPSTTKARFELQDTERFEDGLQIMTYAIEK